MSHTLTAPPEEPAHRGHLISGWILTSDRAAARGCAQPIQILQVGS